MLDEEVPQEAEEIVQEEKKLLTPKKIQDDILAGEKWVKSGPYGGAESRWKQWELNKKYLMCIWPDSDPDDVNYNSIWSNYNTVRPTLYFKNPKVNASAKKPSFTRDSLGEFVLDGNGRRVLADNYKAAKLISIKINHELKEIKFKKTLKKVLGDTLCPYGVGWVKVGYSKKTVGGLNNDRSTGYSFWISRVDPRNLVYHWMSTDNDNNRFTAERLVMTRQEARDYGFKIPQEYVCSLPDFMKDRADSANPQKSDDDIVIVWEYHDHVGKMVYWSLVGSGDSYYSDFPKDPEEDPYPFEGSCYVPLVLNEDNDDIIGLSDVEPIEDQAKAINRIRSKQTKHIEWYGTKTVYEDGAIDEHEIEKTKNTDHGHYVKVKKSMINSVRTETPPSMGQDVYSMDAIHKEDIRTTLGITEYQQGSAGAASTKATTSSIVQNSAVIRIEERRDVIYDFVIECVRKLSALIQYFSQEEDYLDLSDEDLDEDFVETLKSEHGFNPKIPFLMMSKEDIQGEFNFDFSIEDMIIRPKEVQLQQWTNLLGVVGSNPLLMQAAEKEDIDMGKILTKIFDLAGCDLNEVKRGGPAELTVEQENQMFLRGMEVPEPHRRDNDDEHIIGHSRSLKEIEAKLSEGMSRAQAVMERMQSIQGIADPRFPEQQQLAQSAQQAAQAELDAIEMEMEPIQNIARKMKLHMQIHEQNRMKKETKGLSGSQGQMPQNPTSAPVQQMGILSEANQVG